MAHVVSLRIPTLLEEGPEPREELCYLALRSSSLTVADLIAEKVRAELRKVRLGASAERTVAPLLGTLPIKRPLDEHAAICGAWASFCAGRLSVLVDGAIARGLDQPIELQPSSVVLFYPRPVARC